MVIAILQARVGSSRLPGKILKTIKGKTLLELYINRVLPSQCIDQIVVATTTKSQDDAIAQLTSDMGVDCFRGSENDLLDRYYKCARHFGADVVVRITPDDPFVDYEVVDQGI
jgi:spore coat polysaccharide biosynthesis protein SpsF